MSSITIVLSNLRDNYYPIVFEKKSTSNLIIEFGINSRTIKIEIISYFHTYQVACRLNYYKSVLL